ncbi:MAG: YihY/virulence factor BrkB family protein [Actinomycetota bacterium]|nr:YihY/virulence factor BrkB family protein [Actinomycetota bacterium]
MIKLIARLLTFKFVISGLRSRQGGAPPSGPRARAAFAGPSSRSPSARAEQNRSAGAGRGIPVQAEGSPGPDSPLDLDPLDWKATAKRTLKEIKDDRVTLIAAGMAYYWFLALFPAVIAAIGVLGLISAPESMYESIEASVRNTLPSGAGDIIATAIENARGPAGSASLVAALVGIAVALWSASSGMVALQKGLNVAYDVAEERKFVKARLVGFALILATGLLGGVPSPIFTFGESTVFIVIGWILTVVAVMVMFSLYYYLGPNRESPRWTWVSTGGIVGALLWLIVSIGFGFYVTEFDSYGKTYGSMAGVVVLILWLFLTSVSVLIGGELNAELERQASRKGTASS